MTGVEIYRQSPPRLLKGPSCFRAQTDFQCSLLVNYRQFRTLHPFTLIQEFSLKNEVHYMKFKTKAGKRVGGRGFVLFCFSSLSFLKFHLGILRNDCPCVFVIQKSNILDDELYSKTMMFLYSDCCKEIL